MLGVLKIWFMLYIFLFNKVYVVVYCVLSEAEVSAGKCVVCFLFVRSEV